MNDKKLDSFLKTHAPVAPEPSSDEQQRIWSAIAHQKNQASRQFLLGTRQLFTGVAVAAAVALLVITHNMRQKADLDEFVVESMAVLFEEGENGSPFDSSDSLLELIN